jgi:hypothetical protein
MVFCLFLTHCGRGGKNTVRRSKVIDFAERSLVKQVVDLRDLNPASIEGEPSLPGLPGLVSSRSEREPGRQRAQRRPRSPAFSAS